MRVLNSNELVVVAGGQRKEITSGVVGSLITMGSGWATGAIAGAAWGARTGTIVGIVAGAVIGIAWTLATDE